MINNEIGRDLRNAFTNIESIKQTADEAKVISTEAKTILENANEAIHGANAAATNAQQRLEDLSSVSAVQFHDRQNAFDVQLAQTMSVVGLNDVILNEQDIYIALPTSIPRIDGDKVSALINDDNNKNRTFHLQDGAYELDSPIIINSEVSIKIEDGANIKAIKEMDYMLWFRGVGNTKRKIITGGKWDGNNLAAKCIHVEYSTHAMFEKMQLSNPKQYGLYVESGYELIVENMLFINTTKSNITGNTAIYVNTFDSVFNEITIVNYTIGMEIRKTANYFTNIHIWGNQVERLAHSVGLYDRGGYNWYDKVYFDTCSVSVVMHGSSHFKNCMFAYADNYKIEGVNPVYLSNQGGFSNFFDSCGFRYDRQNGSSNVAQMSTGAIDLIQYVNCNFATPESLTNRPVGNNIRPKIFKFRLSLTGMAAITAGNSIVIDRNLSELFGFNDLKADDTVIFNTTMFSWGIIPSCFAIDNRIQIQLNNVSSQTLTPANGSVIVTIIKNHDNTPLTYRQ